MVATDSQTMVLIVEDDADTAEMLRRYLLKKNVDSHCVGVVGDARAALEYLERDKPQCMIIDDMLPGMSGMELVKQIRAEPEFDGISLLMYSAGYDWRKQMEAEAIGAKRWYVKGVSRVGDLIDQVVRICDSGGAAS